MAQLKYIHMRRGMLFSMTFISLLLALSLFPVPQHRVMDNAQGGYFTHTITANGYKSGNVQEGKLYFANGYKSENVEEDKRYFASGFKSETVEEGKRYFTNGYRNKNAEEGKRNFTNGYKSDTVEEGKRYFANGYKATIMRKSQKYVENADVNEELDGVNVQKHFSHKHSDRNEDNVVTSMDFSNDALINKTWSIPHIVHQAWDDELVPNQVTSSSFIFTSIYFTCH